MNAPTLRQSFHAPGVTAELSWRGWRCLLEITVDPASPLAGARLTCELLLQPLDERRLPAGPMSVLSTGIVRLQRTENGAAWRGRLWLSPRINFPLARNCYYCLARV